MTAMSRLDSVIVFLKNNTGVKFQDSQLPAIWFYFSALLTTQFSVLC